MEAFSLTGIKHNTVTKIYNFKQLEIETVRDCSKILKKYLLRCPEIEIPSQEWLVSLFLEGLLNHKLHAALYPKKHKTLNACIKEAVVLDDKIDDSKDGGPMGLEDFESDKSSKSRVVARQNQPLTTSPRVPTVQELANEILKQLNLAQGPPIRNEPLCPQIGANQIPPQFPR